MTEVVTAALLGDEGSALVTAVERALDGVTTQVVETAAEAVSAASTTDCIVATSVDHARDVLERGDGELTCPVVVLTADEETATSADRDAEGETFTDHGQVREHPLDSLETLESRVCDAVLAERERQRTTETETVPAHYAELVERESAYRTLIENIPNGGVALFDCDLRYTWVGGEVFGLVDLDPDDVAGQTVEDVHSAAFVDAYGDTYRRVFAGERATIEFSYDGRQFRMDLIPVHEDGDVVAGMTMVRDITAEAERRRDLYVRSRAMDAAAIGLCLTDPTDPENPLVYVNEGYERMTGYDAEEVLGLNPRHLQGPETEADAARQMRAAVENGERVAVDITNYRKDGTPFVNHVEITPIFDDDGTLVTFLGSQMDVTDQHRREQALARQNEELDEFASIVSHDLRSPLSVIRGRIDLARQTGDLSHLDHAESSLDRAAALIDELLTLAREGRALDTTRVERVSLDEVAHAAWETVETSDATLSVVDTIEVDADESRFQQLLENLFRNSVEHGSTSRRPAADDSVEHGSTSSRSETGDSVEHGSTTTDERPSVAVRVGALTDDRGFFVEDDGPGVPDEIRDRAFEVGVTTVEGGTGFGLSIVRSVAEAHGWAVRLTESETGGARFEFTVS